MPETYQSENFKLSYGFDKNGATINLKVLGNVCNTSQFPNIYPLILTIMPSILRNRCYNEEHLPFSEEVGKTEIGHFLEHVILEYMCLLKARASKSVSFSGRTFWEKSENPAKNFTIKISCSLADFPFFIKSLERSVEVLNLMHKFRGRNLPVAAPSPGLPPGSDPVRLLPHLDLAGQDMPNNRSMSHR